MSSIIKKLPVINKVVKIKDLYLERFGAVLAYLEAVSGHVGKVDEKIERLSAIVKSESEAIQRRQGDQSWSSDRFFQSILKEVRILEEDIADLRLRTQLRTVAPATQRDDGQVTEVQNGQQSAETKLSPLFKGLTRLRRKGFVPDFILDVGASNGCWSNHASLVFPKARYILVDPLFSRYETAMEENYLKDHPEFELEECAISNQPGKLQIHVAANMFSSSMFWLPSSMHRETVEVPVTTLDDLAQKKAIVGRGLLKLDIQFAEHLALEGGQKLLQQIDAVIIELAMYKVYPDTKPFAEMLALMEAHGFRYFDDVGEYRNEEDMLAQKDGMFVRKEPAA